MSGDVTLIDSGIEPFDEQVGGLEQGGNCLVPGAPGPEKLVAALQFVDQGVPVSVAFSLPTPRSTACRAQR